MTHSSTNILFRLYVRWMIRFIAAMWMTGWWLKYNIRRGIPRPYLKYRAVRMWIFMVGVWIFLDVVEYA